MSLVGRRSQISCSVSARLLSQQHQLIILLAFKQHVKTQTHPSTFSVFFPSQVSVAPFLQWRWFFDVWFEHLFFPACRCFPVCEHFRIPVLQKNLLPVFFAGSVQHLKVLCQCFQLLRFHLKRIQTADQLPQQQNPENLLSALFTTAVEDLTYDLNLRSKSPRNPDKH